VVWTDTLLKSDEEIKNDRRDGCSANWCHDWSYKVLLGSVEMPIFLFVRSDRRCKFEIFHNFPSLFD